MFGSASQGGKQADQLYFGMLGSLIAFLWSAAEYLHVREHFTNKSAQLTRQLERFLQDRK